MEKETSPNRNFMKDFKKYSGAYADNESSVPGIDNDFGTDRGGTEQWVGLRNIGADRPEAVHDRAFKPEAEVLREGIMRALSEATDVDANDVSIDVENGIVSLSGTVPEAEMKRTIENYAAAIPGVRSVENRLAERARSTN